MINNFISFNISKRLNKTISNPGKIFIKGNFSVSNKIINATDEIIKTNKNEKKLLIFIIFKGFNYTI